MEGRGLAFGQSPDHLSGNSKIFGLDEADRPFGWMLRAPFPLFNLVVPHVAVSDVPNTNN